MLAVMNLLTKFSFAQKNFTEGYIKYDVFVNNEEKANGIYIITVKAGNIKRELSMNNGYSNITIYIAKNDKTLSYNLAEGNKYALELSAQELIEKNKKFEGAKYTNFNQTKSISGYNCQENKVKYTNGEEADFYYTSELLPPSDKFNAMFPGLSGIPLQYEIASNNGMKMKFVANTINNSIVDSKVFTIPSDYKIVTKSELEKLK